MLAILKVIDEVGGFLIPTKQLQNTLKFWSLIKSRLKRQLWHIQGLPPAAKETGPCSLGQDGGCKNATLGLQVCGQHNDFQIWFYPFFSFLNRVEIFFFLTYLQQ